MSETLERSAGAVCPNCGGPRADRFCPRCGQNDRSYIRSLPRMVWEFLREAFELDSRLVRTLKLMAVRPGELPAEFSRDRRASYASPVRLFLFASLAFFFVLSLTADLDMENGERIAAVRERPDPPGAEANVHVLRALLPPSQARKLDEIMADEERFTRTMILAGAANLKLDADVQEMGTFGRFLLAQMVDVLHQPAVAFDKLLDNLPIAMFFMLPGYALLLAFLHWRRRRYYVEHLVFGMHIHIVAFVACTVMLLLPDDDVVELGATAIMLWLGAYQYMALRTYYGDGRIVTGAKWLALVTLYSIMLAPALLLVMFVTLYSL